jgi:anti-anti-sigma regulatory factor
VSTGNLRELVVSGHRRQFGLTRRVTVISVADPPDELASTALAVRLERAIDDPGALVVVDLSHAAALDATTLTLLVRTGRRFRRTGRSLRVSLGSFRARRLLAVTLLDQAFLVCPTLGEAIRSVRVVDNSG